jgi:phage-related protein
MSSKWIVEFYKDADGREPVRDYILEGNDPKQTALLLNIIERLRELGPDLIGTNMDKHIDGPIRELRKNRHRVLYGREGNHYILLTAFLKMTQKTPPEQISLAKQRFEENKRTHLEKQRQDRK